MACGGQRLDTSESLLDCSICVEYYDDHDHSPIMFRCQHTVCKACLKGLLEAHSMEEYFPCPICRVQVEIKADGVEGYAKSHLLMDILHQEKAKIKCKEHPHKTVSHYCITCGKTLCSTCIVHLMKEHSSHEIEEVEDTYARKNKRVALLKTFTNDVVSQMENIVMQGKELKSALEEAKGQVARLAGEAEAHIRVEQGRLEDELNRLYKDIIESDNNEDIDSAFESKRVALLNTTWKGMDKLSQETNAFITQDDLEKFQQEAAEQLQGMIHYETKLQQAFKVIPGKLKFGSLASVQVKVPKVKKLKKAVSQYNELQ